MVGETIPFLFFFFSCSIVALQLPSWSVVKNLPAGTGNTSSIPESGRSSGEGYGSTLQYSCLGNPVDRGTWWATVCGGHRRVGHNLASKTIVALQCCFSFCPTVKWINFIYSLFFGFPSHLGSQSIQSSSLCYTVQ